MLSSAVARQRCPRCGASGRFRGGPTSRRPPATLARPRLAVLASACSAEARGAAGGAAPEPSPPPRSDVRWPRLPKERRGSWRSRESCPRPLWCSSRAVPTRTIAQQQGPRPRPWRVGGRRLQRLRRTSTGMRSSAWPTGRHPWRSWARREAWRSSVDAAQPRAVVIRLPLAPQSRRGSSRLPPRSPSTGSLFSAEQQPKSRRGSGPLRAQSPGLASLRRPRTSKRFQALPSKACLDRKSLSVRPETRCMRFSSHLARRGNPVLCSLPSRKPDHPLWLLQERRRRHRRRRRRCRQQSCQQHQQQQHRGQHQQQPPKQQYPQPRRWPLSRRERGHGALRPRSLLGRAAEKRQLRQTQASPGARNETSPLAVTSCNGLSAQSRAGRPMPPNRPLSPPASHPPRIRVEEAGFATRTRCLRQSVKPPAAPLGRPQLGRPHLHFRCTSSIGHRRPPLRPAPQSRCGLIRRTSPMPDQRHAPTLPAARRPGPGHKAMARPRLEQGRPLPIHDLPRKPQARKAPRWPARGHRANGPVLPSRRRCHRLRVEASEDQAPPWEVPLLCRRTRLLCCAPSFSTILSAPARSGQSCAGGSCALCLWCVSSSPWLRPGTALAPPCSLEP